MLDLQNLAVVAFTSVVLVLTIPTKYQEFCQDNILFQFTLKNRDAQKNASILVD